MKKILFSLLLFICVLSSKAQTDTLSLIQAYNNFNAFEKAEWTSFINDWNYFDYSKLLKDQHIKSINCKQCSSLYADVYLEVDNKGKVKKTVFRKGKKCGEKLSDKATMDWFIQSIEKRSFSSIKNKKFIARFGHVLKC